MNLNETKLPGVYLIEPKKFGDHRGYFFELYNTQKYLPAGIEFSFVQDNLSRSTKNVLRGLHYQLKHPQGKLVTVIRGSVFDVVVDIRQNSPTFKQWIGIELSEDNGRQLYIPPGYAHGFCVLSDEVYFHYKCTDYYHPEDEQGLLWNDPSINVEWPIHCDPIVSEKDLRLLPLDKISTENLPTY